MKTTKVWGVSGRRSLFIWGLFCVTAGVVFLAYTLASLAAGRGEFVMPLDDVYIHFQYARQLAAGQPYVYNPGLAPSSGATSFLYPFILAIGYLIGFQGLNLGLWAMGVGALALVGSMGLVYRIVRFYGGQEWLATATAVIFAITGPVSWHFMSGMETGLVMLFTLGVVDAVGLVLKASLNGHKETPPPAPPQTWGGEISVRKSLTLLVGWAVLVAMIRPEGGLLAVLAVGAVGIWLWRGRKAYYDAPLQRRVWLWLTVPVLAIGIQPAVNLMMTGSVVASGNAAKSIFGIIPFSWNEVIRRVLENWGRMWLEFGTGISPREGMYIAPLVLAVGGVLWLLAKRERRWTGLVVLGWLVGGTLMIATLDTAFWHFKRYQMPFMALLFPLAALSFQLSAVSKRKIGRRLGTGVVGVMAAVGMWTAGQFLQHYALNVDYVYLQPLQMARWLQANTPEDAVVAVHDTGMMRYMGGRTTIDMVGLTTAGAADYWRNGPGSVAEYLMEKRPDYIAAYGPGHGLGLGMIADTSVYGDLLASFPVVLDDHYNVALAANFQGIYKPDWTSIDSAQSVMEPSILNYLSYLGNYRDLSGYGGSINVANLNFINYSTDERSKGYEWKNFGQSQGFPTEVHQLDYINCTDFDCQIVDGGRRINGEELFHLWGTADSGTGSDVILVTRLLPAHSGTLDIYISSAFQSEKLIATRWIPAIPGRWLELATLIPSSSVPSGEGYLVRIVPHVDDGYYEPYFHWAFMGHYQPETLLNVPISTFQAGAIVLGQTNIAYTPNPAQVGVNLEWYTDGSAKGDYKVFVHLYRDIDQPPVAQADQYPGDGTLPPGNWLPGVLRDTIKVDLKGVPPGKYQVAIGLYNPYTNERLQPTGGDDQGRLFIGEVDVQG